MFKKSGLMLFLLVLSFFFSVSAFAETKTISGYVKDENGIGVKGIIVKASEDPCNGNYDWSSSELSNDQGYFTLEVNNKGSFFPQNVYLYTISPEGNYYYVTYKNGDQGSAFCGDATPIDISNNISNVKVPINKGGIVSGRVVDGNNTPLQNILVYISTGCPESEHIVATPKTDASGNYSVVVPAGEVVSYVKPSVDNLPYMTQFWNDTVEGANSCDEANLIQVSKNHDVANVNFKLIEGGTISGRVRDSSYQPIKGVDIYFSGDKCGNNYIAKTKTDENGDYIKRGLPTDRMIYVNSRSKSINQYYIDKAWNSAGCERNCQRAEGISLKGGEVRENINLTLGFGGIISGTVKDSLGNPIQGIVVQAYTEEPCISQNGEWLSDDISDSNGHFTVPSIPAGSVFLSAVVTPERVKDSKYLKTAYWNGVNGTSVCKDNIPFKVEVNTTYSNTDFILDTIGIIKGKVLASDGHGVNGLSINAYANKCDSFPVYSSYTTGNGNFIFNEVNGLNALYLRVTDPSETPLWMGGWYANYARVTNQCSEADSVQVVIRKENNNTIYIESVKEFSYENLTNAKSISMNAVKQSKKGKLKAKKAKTMGNKIQAYLDNLLNYNIQVTKVSSLKKKVKTAIKRNKLKNWKAVDNGIKKLLNGK